MAARLEPWFAWLALAVALPIGCGGRTDSGQTDPSLPGTGNRSGGGSGTGGSGTGGSGTGGSGTGGHGAQPNPSDPQLTTPRARTTECIELCQRSERCEGGTAGNPCETTCTETETLNAAAKCTEPYRRLLLCARDHDICRDDICTMQTDAYINCLLEFCSVNPDACSGL